MLNTSISKIRLDVTQKNVLPKIYAKQADDKSRYITAELVSSGEIIDLTDCQVLVYAQKPNGDKLFNDCEITDKSNGVVNCELTNQMLALNGNLKLEISIFLPQGGVLTTQPFIVEVDKTLRDDSAIESSNEFSALTEAINKVGDFAAISDSASAAAGAAQEAAHSASQAAARAEQAVNGFVPDGSVTAETLSLARANLFDKSKYTAEKILNDGSTAAAAGYICTDFIPVRPGSTYTCPKGNNRSGALYDQSKNFLQNINFGAAATEAACIIVPPNVSAAWLRISYNLNGDRDLTPDNFMICIGDKYYGKYIPFGGAYLDWLHAAEEDAKSPITNTASGSLITLTDSADGEVKSLKIYGKSTQDGTPSPDNPAPIVSVGDKENIAVTSCGKNLATLNECESKSPVTISVAKGAIKEDTRYTLSCITTIFPDSSASNRRISAHIEYSDGTSQTHFSEYNVAAADGVPKFERLEFKTKAEKITDFKLCALDYSSGKNHGKAENIQLELGSVATPIYEPYKGQTVKIPLSEPLRSLPNGVCDTYDNGVVTRRVGKVLIDGSEEWTREIGNEIYGVYYVWLSKKKFGSDNLISDKFKTSTNTSNINVVSGRINNPVISITIDASLANDLETFKQWLSTNNVTVLYELEKPTTEQLKSIDLSTYYPNTFITNDENADMEVEYAVDIKSYIEEVKNQIKAEPIPLDRLSENIAANFTKEIYGNIYPDWVSGKYLQAAVGEVFKEFSDNTHYGYAKIPVIPQEKFIIDAAHEYKSAGYFTADENNVVIRVDGAADNVSTPVHGEIEILENEKYLYIGKGGFTSLRKLLRIGVEKSYNLANKKIVYDGDSICESRTFGGTIDNGGAYAKLIADKVCGSYENQAVSGGNLTSPSAKHSVVDNLVNLPKDGDLYCFEGGINDFWAGVEIGTCSSSYTDELNTSTLCGALEYIFRYALNNFAGKPICFVIAHKIKNTAYDKNISGNTFTQWHDKMIEICNKYSIPYYDAFLNSGLNGWNQTQSEKFLTASADGKADGTHPNIEGYRKFYVPQLISLFESLID